MTDPEHCGECGDELTLSGKCVYCEDQYRQQIETDEELGEEAAEEVERENFTAIKRDYEMRR
tara:strand:+ start:1074 stop:1259 length:186 start_codon:yes stop_codon:yes gene_type:complete